MQAEPTTNLEQAMEFLSSWAPDGPWVLTSILPDKRTINTSTFRNIEDAGAWILEQNKDCNIYFTVNDVVRDLFSKPSRAEIAAMSWLHVDIDPRPGEDIQEEQERALKLLQNPPSGIPQPTVILFSGGGYQGFWKLDESFKIEGKEELYEEAALYNKQIEISYGGDHCHNVDRIMRLPGTVNHPDAKKRAKGRKPTLARLIEWHADRSYKLSTFTKAQKVQVAGEGFDPNIEVSGNVKRFSSVDELDTLLPDTGAKLSDRCKVVIVQGNTADHDEHKFPSRSEALFYVCCEMVRAGFDNDAIYSVITDPDFGISESVVEKKSSADKYAKKQIRSARERAIDPNLQEMNDKHAVIGDVGGKCRVVSEFPDPITDRPTFSKQSFEDVRNRYCNQKVEVGKDKDGNAKYRPLGHWWLDHKERRYFDRMVFAPGKTIKGSYNLWRGFTVEAKPGNCEKFLSHIRKNLCKGDSSLYAYLIKWMARAVQHPDKPGYSAVVLRGEMGTGKSFFVEQFGHLFGSHFLPVSDPKFLVGSFNSHLEDCVILFGEEAFYAGDTRHEGVLKNLITGKVLMIEEKGLNLRKSRSCIHLMMASNSEWVVPAGLKDRRFFVLDVGNDSMQNTAYFGAIQKQLDEGGYEALLHHLITMDISDFDVRTIPQTEGLKNQQLESLDPTQVWWYSKLQDGVVMPGDNGWRDTIPCRDLENDYISYTKRNNVGRRSSVIQLKRFLNSVVPNGVKRYQSTTPIEITEIDGTITTLTRPYFYPLQSLADCRNYWDSRFTKLTDWVEPLTGSDESVF